MGRIMLQGFTCERCQHIWAPRNPSAVPKVCPKCKSPYWDSPRAKERKTPQPVGDAGRTFWETPTFEQLVKEQGIKPITDWEKLTSYWPEGEDFDAFLQAIHESRGG